MIKFPGDDLKGYPSTQSPGALLPSVGGAERFNMINANKIVVYDIDAGTASIKDATITTAKIGLLQVTEATIAALAVTTAKIDSLAVTEAKIGALAVTNAKINDLSASKINAGVMVVGGSGNAVQFQANNSSDALIVQINNDGMVFANTGSPGLFFNNPGGATRATIFNDGSGNLAFRAGSSDNIYYQKGDGTNTTLIVNTDGRVVQIGESSDTPATLYIVPRSAAPGSPSRGMIYYDSDDDKLYCHNGTGWQALY